MRKKATRAKRDRFLEADAKERAEQESENVVITTLQKMMMRIKFCMKLLHMTRRKMKMMILQVN